ncbi:DUF4097 and DUF4098 domain-containing protein YvlB [Enterococcus sp. PF1-24]|uniref:DUF4097 family beta strand repeat-containing protein n=1 Tax=unclassified Enterococcus TaxID=2608891 RepID=UPI00247379A8|nr:MULTISPECIES: DUF4097 family beta strand repeat-containing protein [unclassified Enterococcus]MDH6365340.1 DUF4097 and DUF4098 domain-containing protein YvlB [Enterococcus sp. PFB1-1]MDH6402441.1 DUF4097 and DUF4098 domain-containing protein YvlB [Enterococcus sp. PF1-24]
MRKNVVRFLLILALIFAVFRLRSQSQKNDGVFEADAAVSTIAIEDKNIQVQVIGTDRKKDSLTVYYQENQQNDYDISLKREHLVIQKRNRPFNFLFSWLNFDFTDRTLVIEIPQQQLDSLDLETTNGKVLIENLEVEKAKINTTNGEIKINNSNFSDYLESETTNGKVLLEDNEIADGTIETTNGKVIFANLAITNSLSVETTNATVSGDIVGHQKDFEITSKTTNAKSNLPKNSSNSAKKILEIETTNGSIMVDFTKD